MRFKRNSHSVTLFLSLVWAMSGCSFTDEEIEPGAIGIVIAASGSPSVVRNNRTYILDNQSRIFKSDIVQTDLTSKAAIEMIDDSRIEIGPASHIVFRLYDYTPDAGSPNARITLTSGSLRTSTRFGVNAWRTRYEIQTPVALINVLGADVWGGFIFADNTLDVALLEGRGFIVDNRHGRTEITTAGQGTTVIGGTAPQPATPWSISKLQRATQETGI
ncbi:MAG: FecR domain-containing protein [Pseudomonadales bacterium]